jgi:hypothetical protein
MTSSETYNRRTGVERTNESVKDCGFGRTRAVRVDQASVRASRVSVAFSNIFQRRLVFIEVVDCRHNPLCRLLSLDLRQDLAEVVRRHIVKRGHIGITYSSLKIFSRQYEFGGSRPRYSVPNSSRMSRFVDIEQSHGNV